MKIIYELIHVGKAFIMWLVPALNGTEREPYTVFKVMT